MNKADTLKIKVLNNNSIYRLSDLFWGRNPRDADRLLSCGKYQDSILTQYIKNKKKFKDWDTLAEIVEKKLNSNSFKKAAKRELVLHARLGDVFVSGKSWLRENSRSFYENLIKEIPSWRNAYDIDKVTCVTAHHFGHEYPPKLVDSAVKTGLSYLSKINNQINRNGWSFDYFSNEDFDKDLIYMVSSSNYVASYQQGFLKCEKFGSNLGISDIINELRALLSK
jgi:hypothetical protein